VIINWGRKYRQVRIFGIFGRYSVFFGICNTDVGIGIGILKYRDIGIGIGITDPGVLHRQPIASAQHQRSDSRWIKQHDVRYSALAMFVVVVSK